MLPKHVSAGLFQSRLMIVQSLFPEGNPKKSSKKPNSISSNLRTSMHSLVQMLANRRNHYVFCVRPNDFKQSRSFELPLVQHQIRCYNLLPLMQLWRTGHYFSLSHLKFFNRYKLLSNLTWPHFDAGTIVEAIAIIIRSVPLPLAEFTIGSKRVFIRSPRTVGFPQYKKVLVGTFTYFLLKLKKLDQHKFKEKSLENEYTQQLCILNFKDNC